MTTGLTPGEPDPGPPRSTGREALVVGGVLLAFVAAVIVWATRPPALPSSISSDSAYIGERSCRECHPGETAAFRRSGHSRTLRVASRTPEAQKLNGVRVDDPERTGVTWSYSLRDGTFSTERREAGEVERFVIDYAFGSGRHAATFVTLTDRDPKRPAVLEHRLTAFTHKGLDVTPGQSAAEAFEGTTAKGRNHGPANTLKCFDCHTTIKSAAGVTELDERTMIPNVSCERCHGPARAHVEAARRGAGPAALTMPMGAEGVSALQQIRYCGSCHRLPEQVPPAQLRPDNPELARHQPVGLLLSACYTKSGGKLSCSTCHEPHSRPSSDLASYESVCLSCHQAQEQKPCPESPKTGCIGCHMPRRDVSRGMMMTDHWIQTQPPEPRPPVHTGTGN